MANTKKIEVQFIKSPTGLFKLAHHVGEVVKFPEKQGKELIEAGVAVEAPKPSK